MEYLQVQLDELINKNDIFKIMELYYTICQLNQNALDIFRSTQTFELRNVNKYQWIYNDAKRQFVTIHDSLHTSLNNDIQKSYQTITNQELALQGLNPNSFKTLKSGVENILAVQLE